MNIYSIFSYAQTMPIKGKIAFVLIAALWLLSTIGYLSKSARLKKLEKEHLDLRAEMLASRAQHATLTSQQRQVIIDNNLLILKKQNNSYENKKTSLEDLQDQEKQPLDLSEFEDPQTCEQFVNAFGHLFNVVPESAAAIGQSSAQR